MRCVTAVAALFAVALLGFATAPARPQQGEVVEVSFPNSAHYVDAGDGPREAEANQAALAQHLRSLGKRWLAPGERLQIEITELDLAGQVLPATRLPQRLRVLTGGADWPRIDLRYVLTSAAGEVSRGQESLSDKTYQSQPLQAHDGEPLRYEKRLLTRWFQSRFDKASAKSPESR